MNRMLKYNAKRVDIVYNAGYLGKSFDKRKQVTMETYVALSKEMV
jgi:hypothetical protein